MRRCKYFMVIAVATIFIIAAIITINKSDRIVLRRNGFDLSNLRVLYTSLNEYDEVYRIIKAESAGHPSLAFMRRNNWGIWQLDGTIHDEGQSDYLPIAWSKADEYRIFDDITEVGFESHILCYGDNAEKYVEIPADLLPKNVAVEITQYQNEYWIHFISYDDAALPIGDQLHEIMEKAIK